MRAGAYGDKLLLVGSRKESVFRATNGELVTVRGVSQPEPGTELAPRQLINSANRNPVESNETKNNKSKNPTRLC
jgi:hypothetical protein